MFFIVEYVAAYRFAKCSRISVSVEVIVTQLESHTYTHGISFMASSVASSPQP